MIKSIGSIIQAPRFNPNWTMSQLQENLEKQYSVVDDYFLEACRYDRLDMVEFLLLNSMFKADIHASNDFAIYNACGRGQLEIVEFLLSSPKLKEHIDLFTQNRKALEVSLTYNHTHIVEYLLNIGEKISIKDFEYISNIFTKACQYNSIKSVELIYNIYEQQINDKKNKFNRIIEFIQDKLSVYNNKYISPSSRYKFKQMIEKGLKFAENEQCFDVFKFLLSKNIESTENFINSSCEKIKNYTRSLILQEKLDIELKQKVEPTPMRRNKI